MGKIIAYGEDFRQRMCAGMACLAQAVSGTLGPNGRNVVMYQKAEHIGADYSQRALVGAKAMVINDGATIACGIVLEDPVEDLGAQLLRQVSAATNDRAGDGTTTSVVLAQAIIRKSLTNLASGAHPLMLNKGLNSAVAVAVDALRNHASAVKTQEALARVAAISCQDDDIGAIVAEALFRVGKEGVVEVEAGNRRETTLEIQEGIVFERGFLSPLMATDAAQTEAILDNPLILLYEGKFKSTQDIIPAMLVAAEADRPLLLICEGLEDEAMGLVLQNKLHGDLDVVAVLPPLYGEGRKWRLEDMAVQTGATLISRELGRDIRQVTPELFGAAGQIRVTRNQTVISAPAGDPETIDRWIHQLRYLANHTDYDFNQKRYQERLAKFVSGVAKIRVGGLTETELLERKFRVEDAICAAKAAWEEGIVSGGGTALFRTAKAVRSHADTLDGDARTGAKILAEALEAPLRQIARNSGLDDSVVAGKLARMDIHMGLDARTNRYVDMMAAGIVDPVKVTRLALENAVSVATTLLTSEACLVDINEGGN